MYSGHYNKGDRVRFEVLLATPVCLAGVQSKLQVSPTQHMGVIRHFRADHPTEPTVIKVYLDAEGDCALPRVQAYDCFCDGGHVEVDFKSLIRRY